ncbi:MAG: T9SS type A sorting domain-containing protein [Bacteroidetes bacterium]|nr:T9SS type A sorting domain-containing protein [Bacteroidota bacterium]
MKVFYSFGFIIVYTLIGFSLKAQNLYFETAFGTSMQDIARSIVQLNSGSLFLTGSSASGNLGNTDISLIKLDRYGNEEWTSYFGDANANNGYSLAKCSDGNLILLGDALVSPGDSDILIYKVDTLGGIIWQYEYATSLNESVKCIEQTSDGGFITAGFQTDSSGLNNAFVLKIDGSGNYQWSRSIGGSDNDYASMIKQMPGGNYILTSDTRSHGAGGYDVELTKLDSSGNIIWQNAYGDSLNNGCQGIYLSNDGYFISYGETEIAPGSYFDMFLEKIDTNGVSVWKKYYGDSNRADACFSIIQNNSGDYFLTGYSNTFNGGQAMDLALIKTDVNGNLIWGRGFGAQGVDIGYAIIPSLDNGYYIAGKYFDMEFSDDQYYLIHVEGVYGGTSNLNELKDDDHWTLWPNPSDGNFSVQIDVQRPDLQINIYSIEGKLLLSKQCAEGLLEFNLKGLLNKGFYVVELVSESGVGRKKIVID